MIRPPDASRRRFLSHTAALTASVFAGSGRAGNAGPQDRLRIAVIGCGGRGGDNLQAVSGERIVALCDVNSRNLQRAAERFPEARTFADFRQLYERPEDFDAVVVSTCEHTHAFATLPALKLGKHVYCEKPLTYNVHEARVIREAAANAGVATQMGTQIHADNNYRRVVELIQSGAVGDISEVHVWVGRAWGLQSAEDAKAFGDIVHVTERPAQEDPVPPELNWDLWLGPAPERPFSHVYFPGPKWYRWWDFANGTMSDLGSHWVDLPFWALKLRAPQTIEAFGPPAHPEIAPASMRVQYGYAADGDQPALTLTWYQGRDKPQHWHDRQIPAWDSGVLFVGDRGMVLADYSRHLVLLHESSQEFRRPPQTIPPSLGHHQEWLHACKTGAPTTCNFEYAGWLTEANHLGNVAYRTGCRLQWDAVAMRATNAPEADVFLRRRPRAGWSLE